MPVYALFTHTYSTVSLSSLRIMLLDIIVRNTREKERPLVHLTLSDITSPADLGLAIYEKVQELTTGKSQRSARFLSAITCMEIEGRELPASTWSTLVLFSLSDLAIHAPGVKLALRDWEIHYTNMAVCSGEASAQEIASALVWAGCARKNIELETAAPSRELASV
jgi:hypothetical protein